MSYHRSCLKPCSHVHKYQSTLRDENSLRRVGVKYCQHRGEKIKCLSFFHSVSGPDFLGEEFLLEWGKNRESLNVAHNWLSGEKKKKLHMERVWGTKFFCRPCKIIASAKERDRFEKKTCSHGQSHGQEVTVAPIPVLSIPDLVTKSLQDRGKRKFRKAKDPREETKLAF